MRRPGQSEAGRAGGGRADRRWPGPALLVPGLPQWLWDQRERAALLAGPYASALGAGLFAWGTAPGLVALAFAFALHVASAADAIRQWSFPGLGRWAPTASASAALGLGIYGPLLVLGALVAWPGMETHGARAGYAVDRLAYRGGGALPARGDHVWLAPRRDGSRGRFALVLARPGEEVAWFNGLLNVGGHRLAINPFRPGQDPRAIDFTVPDGQLLVAYPTDDPLLPHAWELVPESRVEGRAWAKIYPIWERRLLN